MSAPLPDPDQMPLELLLRRARREVEEDDPEAPVPFLVAVQQWPTREVFAYATAFMHEDDPIKRVLGLRTLREIGAEQDDGRRPFTAETVPLLRARLRDEPDAGVLGWIVSALGYHRAGEALPEVLPLAGHPDDEVRMAVAWAITGMTDEFRAERLVTRWQDQASH
ncbi:HEAT repeat domain-containing protein [Actinoplanes sp. CA-015351]|uniref:HEAT repeat domain-containing protein n=1 Tax=Actinoplanes sp. CA-015351 TaxID=3239897 RepID=UPI003D96738C